MAIFTRLKGYADAILGASWVDPMRSFLWGGDEGGGDYSSPVSFTATPKGPNQAYLTGVGPTITNASQFRYVRAYNGDGSLHSEYWPCKRHPFIWDALTSYLTVGGANWGSCAYLVVVLHGEHRAYSSTEDAYQEFVVNPEHAWTQQSDTTATAQGDGTTYAYFDVDGYKYLGIQILDTPGATGDQTYTVEASWEDNGTAQAACNYADVTADLFGVASVTSAMITASAAAGVLEIDTPITAKYIRICIVRANDGASTDGGWDIHVRGTY